MLMMKDSIKRYFFCLRFNILPCLFLVFRDIPSCIMLLGYDLSEIGGVTILVVGGFDKVKRVDPKWGVRTLLHTMGKDEIEYG